MMSTFPASLLIPDDKGISKPQLREVVNLLHDEGVDIHVRVTWEKGNAAWFIDEALQLSVETVITDDNDGIINEVTTVLVEHGSKMALGILPLGMASNFATSVGIPQDLVSALKLAIVGRGVPIDIARANDKTGLTNMVTGRFDTRITTKTPEKLKVALGGVSHLIHDLIRMDIPKSDCCEIRGENFRWQDDAPVTGIGSGHQVGGGQQPCSEALTNDDSLHLRIFTGEELIPALFSTLTNPENSPNIVGGISSWSEITVLREMTFSLDGEPFSDKTFCVELLPVALRCRLPPDCPLLC